MKKRIGKIVRRIQKGQAVAEYTICAALLVFALFTPFSEGKSVAGMLIEAVKKNHENKVSAIGNPIVGSSTDLAGSQ